jgi:hypothetical protein
VWQTSLEKSLLRACLLIENMPAIQPAHLKQQAALLAESFDQPLVFVRGLHHLLDFYADRARRSGQTGKPSPLMSAYNVRPPVLSMLLQEWAPWMENDPSLAFTLCDALWRENYLEFRLLAASLLGRIPPEPFEPILNRVEYWAREPLDASVVSALFVHGLSGLRKTDPDRLIQLVEQWLSSESIREMYFGLLALLPLISDPEFKNLPVFFRLIQPFCRETPPALRPSLIDLLIALARRSPQETAYFLRQSFETSNSRNTAWLIRRVVSEFPPDQEKSLRAIVRGSHE